ncbi:MAG: acyl carrier protein [Bacillota bacterium]|nr:MAG: acyl carrier protein [Bacillota bacterium]
MDDVINRVRSVTARILRVDEHRIEMGTRFKADLGADSINLVEIAMALESEFDVTLDDDEVGSIVAVEDAVRYIQKHK